MRQLPAGEFDLALSRDAFQHLSPGDIVGALAQLNHSRFGMLLVSNYDDVAENRATRGRDPPRWDTHQYNLRLPPYGLGEPLRAFADPSPNDPTRRKSLLLYRLPFANAESGAG